MAEATVELRNLLKTDFELFDFDYQFDDQEFKKELEQAIIDHYFFYEISGYTVDQFKHRFRTRWQRIIKHYNRLYNTTLLEYNPLVNYSMDEALDQLAKSNNTQTNESNSNTNSSSEFDTTNTTDQTTTSNGSQDTDENVKNSDYPQQPIAGSGYLNGEQDTVRNTTDQNTTNVDGTDTSGGTSSSNDNINTTGTVTDNGSTNTNYTKTIEGLTGTSYQELIQKERQNLIRITSMVIEEMKPCFILVY